MSEKDRFTTILSKDLIKQMKIRAVEEDITVADIIEKSFNFYIENIDATFKIRGTTEPTPKINIKMTDEHLKDIVAAAIKEVYGKVLIGEKDTSPEEKSEK